MAYVLPIGVMFRLVGSAEPLNGTSCTALPLALLWDSPTYLCCHTSGLVTSNKEPSVFRLNLFSLYISKKSFTAAVFCRGAERVNPQAALQMYSRGNRGVKQAHTGFYTRLVCIIVCLTSRPCCVVFADIILHDPCLTRRLSYAEPDVRAFPRKLLPLYLVFAVNFLMIKCNKTLV